MLDNYYLNLLFWIVCMLCGVYAIFSESWNGNRGFLKSWDPKKRMYFFRITGFVLVFTGLWMFLRYL